MYKAVRAIYPLSSTLRDFYIMYRKLSRAICSTQPHNRRISRARHIIQNISHRKHLPKDTRRRPTQRFSAYSADCELRYLTSILAPSSICGSRQPRDRCQQSRPWPSRTPSCRLEPHSPKRIATPPRRLMVLTTNHTRRVAIRLMNLEEGQQSYGLAHRKSWLTPEGRFSDSRPLDQTYKH